MMNNYLKYYLFLTLCIVIPASVECANILLLTHTFGSFVKEITVIGDTLAARGHNVYIILPESSNFDSYSTMQNIKTLKFPVKKNDVFMHSKEFVDATYGLLFKNDMSGIGAAIAACETPCQRMLEDSNLIHQVKELKFDLAIVSVMTENRCLLIFPHVLGIPYISSFAMLEKWQMGIPALPSFVPHHYLPFGEKMTFLEKLQNVWIHIQGPQSLEGSSQLQKKHIPTSSLDQLFRDSSFFIIYRDELLEWPQPRMPNTLFTPGITYLPASHLEDDVKVIVEQKGSHTKVILVSFGTNINSIPADIFSKFIQVFTKMSDYVFLWKYGGNIPHDINIPDNVHLMSWVPQNDLLAHPNMKLFITHCGNNGQYESLYHGIPMIGVPFFIDQIHNAHRIYEHGYGLYINIRNFTVQELHEIITNVLSNSTISESIKRGSNILKDRPHPKEEVAYWVEHIIQFGGSHLRGISMELPWYKLLMIDILAAVIGVVIVILFFLTCICRIVCFKRKSKEKTQ